MSASIIHPRAHLHAHTCMLPRWKLKSFYVAQMEQNPIDGMHAAQMEQIPMDYHLHNEPGMFVLLTYCLLFVFTLLNGFLGNA